MDDDELSVAARYPITYLDFGLEIGAEGTPHLQGQIELCEPCMLLIPRSLVGRTTTWPSLIGGYAGSTPAEDSFLYVFFF